PSPRRAAPTRAPGRRRFGVRVKSREDPEGSVVDEGVITVAAFMELRAEVTPRTSHGRMNGRHELVIDNLGNAPAEVELIATDTEERLSFRFRQPTLTVDPGTAAFVPFTARPHKRYLRGVEHKHQFQTTVLTTGGDPVSADGTFIQNQLLPKWLLPALAALIALLILAVVLWFTIVKPEVQSTAKQAAQEQVTPVISIADRAQQQAESAQQQAAQAQQAAGGGNAPKPGAGTGAGGTGATDVPGTATDFRIVANAAVTADANNFKKFGMEVPPPADKVLVVTDFLLQNPYGDNGIIRIQRDNQVLAEFGLGNFRAFDYHVGQTWRILPGQHLVITVNCQSATSGTCRSSASFSGKIQ
ncbi:LOW QUALITY PROTEIN: LigA protein, partial [Kutzneria sp. 744]